MAEWYYIAFSLSTHIYGLWGNFIYVAADDQKLGFIYRCFYIILESTQVCVCVCVRVINTTCKYTRAVLYRDYPWVTIKEDNIRCLLPYKEIQTSSIVSGC